MANSLPSIPERFLRQLWKHQYLKTLELRTTEGDPVSILASGHPNPDSGPDFLDAVVTVGSITYRGDVELHYSLRDWHLHAHDVDSRYNRVILHVVFTVEREAPPSFTMSRRAIPVLHLAPFLSHSLQDLWHAMILDERAERLARIKCFGLNEDVPGDTIREWLQKLAAERLELKVRRFEGRLRQLVEEQKLRINEPTTDYGTIPFGLNPEEIPPPAEKITQRDYAKRTIWAQLLYEGMMEALGYAKNREPFRRLSRILPLAQLKRILEDYQTPRTAEAMLFGVSGLLPEISEGAPDENSRYVRQLQNAWSILRLSHRGDILHRSDWKFFRLRPENFPTVRIAGAANIVMDMVQDDYFARIMQAIKTEGTRTDEEFAAVQSMFITSADDYWTDHYRFGEKSPSAITALIGKDRANDIVVNTVVPLAFLYARVFRNAEIRTKAMRLLNRAPLLSDNTIIKTIRHQLVRGRFIVRSATLQQGAVQLYKHYCVGERCAECAVGKLVFPHGIS